MNNSMISASVSMSGIQQRLDLLSENIANLNTTGYKRKEGSFEDTLTRVKEQVSKMELAGRATPLGFNLGFGSRMTSITSSFTQGAIKETGSATDLAIEGNALFAVLTEDGRAYTRAGDFHVQPDPADADSSYLVTGSGHFVLNTDGEPVAIPSGAELKIDPQGRIQAVVGGVPEDLGQLQMLTPIRPDALEAIDGNLYRLAAGALETDVMADTWALPLEQQAQIRQGALEGSNVNLTDEMAELLQVQRAYQLMARALTSSETMAGLANTLRG